MATANAMSNVIDGRLYNQVITCTVTHSNRGADGTDAHTQHYINRKQKGPIVAPRATRNSAQVHGNTCP